MPKKTKKTLIDVGRLFPFVSIAPCEMFYSDVVDFVHTTWLGS